MNFVSLISVPSSINLDFVTTTLSLEADLSLDHLRIIMTSVSIFDSKNKCPDWCLPHLGCVWYTLCGGGKCNKLDRGMQWKILLSSKMAFLNVEMNKSPAIFIMWLHSCLKLTFIFITKTKPNSPLSQFITERKTRTLELDTFSLKYL